MTLRFSTGYRNAVQQRGSCKHTMNNGEIRVFSGSQPADADQAETGTLLFKLTKSSGTRTAETKASGTVTLTGGASGSVNSVLVNSIDILGAAVSFNSTLTQTATDVATQINNNPKNLLYDASATGAVITITARPGLGSLPNTWVVSATLTTITATYVDLASGVTAVNGITWGVSTAGVLVKNPAETWSGVGVAAGTAGWFRAIGSVSDAGTLDSTGVQVRVDGSIATSGADLNMTSTTVAVSAVQTVNTFSITEPAA